MNSLYVSFSNRFVKHNAINTQTVVNTHTVNTAVSVETGY